MFGKILEENSSPRQELTKNREKIPWEIIADHNLRDRLNTIVHIFPQFRTTRFSTIDIENINSTLPNVHVLIRYNH